MAPKEISRRALLAAAALAAGTGCGGSDLRAERAAYERLEAQRETRAREWKGCEAKHEAPRLEAAWQASRERYARANDAVWRLAIPTMAALTEYRDAGAAREEAFDAWQAASKEVESCASGALDELSIRRAEYLAACRRCGVEERCVANAAVGATGEGRFSRFGCER